MSSQKEDLLKIIELVGNKLISSERVLTDLDSEIGDGDCGSGIKRGFQAVLDKLPSMAEENIGGILKKVGFTLASTIGGTSGAILGTGFMEFGRVMGEAKDPALKDWVLSARSAMEKMKVRGEGTKVGDKTLIDALEPAVNSMVEFAESDKNDIRKMLETAYGMAKKGSESTRDMIAKKGRASYLGERTIGKIDPGSVVICLIFEAALNYYAE